MCEKKAGLHHKRVQELLVPKNMSQIEEFKVKTKMKTVRIRLILKLKMNKTRKKFVFTVLLTIQKTEILQRTKISLHILKVLHYHSL